MVSDFIKIDQIEVSSELKNLVMIEQFIDNICVRKNVSEDLYGNVLIAVTEAISNAIIHGNLLDAKKKVVLDVLDDSKDLCFIVKDEGKGFDFNNLPDPTAPENLEKENGRGIFLIKNLADRFEFLLPGNVIQVYFTYA